MNQPNTAALARVKQLRADIYNNGKGFASLMAVTDMSDPRFVAWQSEVAHVVSSNPKLLRADRPSLLESLRTALTMGLSINPLLGEAYLIPRWNSKARAELVQCQIGYQGLKKLMYESGEIDSLHVDVAYRGETFKYKSGDSPRVDHEPDVTGELRTNAFEDIVCAYASIRLKGSERPIITLVTKRQLADAASKNTDRDGNWSLPWREHTEAMCWKVALTRGTKALPRTKGLARVYEMLNEESARATVSQMEPPKVEKPAPPSNEPSRWEIACEYYQGAGVSADQLLDYLSCESADQVTDDFLDQLERIYGDARSGNEKAKAVIAAMRGDTPPDQEADANTEEAPAEPKKSGRKPAPESIEDEEIPF